MCRLRVEETKEEGEAEHQQDRSTGARQREVCNSDADQADSDDRQQQRNDVHGESERMRQHQGESRADHTSELHAQPEVERQKAHRGEGGERQRQNACDFVQVL